MLILASASPRRHQLLTEAGIEHLVRPANVREIRLTGEPPAAFVQRLAQEKARAVPRGPGEITLGSDTVVCLGNEVFGKPRDEGDAQRMLRLLSGRDHVVYTGICLLNEKCCLLDLAQTTVTFARLTDEEISQYTRSGEPADKAGAYAIQGLASKFVLSIEGSYTNVVGLPISLVYRHLKALSS